MRTISIRISDELYEKVRREAEKEGKTVSGYVKGLIERCFRDVEFGIDVDEVTKEASKDADVRAVKELIENYCVPLTSRGCLCVGDIIEIVVGKTTISGRVVDVSRSKPERSKIIAVDTGDNGIIFVYLPRMMRLHILQRGSIYRKIVELLEKKE